MADDNSKARPMSPCTRTTWCTGMREALAGVAENATGKGLSVSRGWIGEEKKPRVLGVTYHQGRGKNGIVLNVCPWCATRIRFDDAGGSKPAGEDNDISIREVARKWCDWDPACIDSKKGNIDFCKTCLFVQEVLDG